MTGSLLTQTPSCLMKISASRMPFHLAAKSTSLRPLHNYSTSSRTICTAFLNGNRSIVTQSESLRPTTTTRSCQTPPMRRTFTQTATRKQDTPATQLTWDDFLKLRKTRRYISLVSSIGTAVGSTAIAVPIMAQYEVENQIAALTGLDPFIGIGLTITAIGGVGWLLGPFVGNAAFGIWKSSLRGEIARREKDFYGHIKRYRADPTSSSVNNPVPDYYGEKIGSVADYRRWLKDQRAFTRKKNKNLL